MSSFTDVMQIQFLLTAELLHSSNNNNNNNNNKQTFQNAQLTN